MPRKNSKQQKSQSTSIARAVRPPPYQSVTKFTVRRRYVTTSSASGTVSGFTLCDSIGAVCTATNASIIGVAAAARIISVELWGAAASSTLSSSTVSISWNPGTNTAAQFGSNLEVSDTSTSSAIVPYIKSRPPKESAAAFWNARLLPNGTLNTGFLFQLSAPTGSFVDVVTEVCFLDAGKATALVATPITSGTAGSFAYVSLDGVAGTYNPVSVGFFT
jgi:hypothetical protein